MTLARAIGAAVLVGSVLAHAAPALADGHRYRQYPDYYSSPRPYKSNPGNIRYYNVCGYGDCVCLRNRAVATGSQVWWDRYQACSGN